MTFPIFTEFAIIILIAATLGLFAVKLKQPPILGYILTGLIIGPLTPFFKPDVQSIELLSQIGIAFLLFTLGLELKVAELKKIGKVALATGLGQIIFTSLVGYFLSLALGFTSIASIYMAIGLSFSSTIVIIKLLSAKNQLDSLFGRISIGFLLVQDFVAILILIGLSALKNVGGDNIYQIVGSLSEAFVKGIVAALVIYMTVRFILNPILNSLKTEKEIMFLLTIAWALICAAVMKQIGFTLEVGGVMAGIALSSRFEQLQIESWTRPLRDFFLALFFVLLGANIQIETVNQALLPSLFFSIFVLIGNPIIVMLIMGLLGYKKKTSFLTSLSVAQISEFSLLLVSYAYRELGQVNDLAITTMTIVGGITMTISSYMIYYNEQLYQKLSKYLGIFELKNPVENSSDSDTNLKFYKSLVLFGCRRTGKNLLRLMNIPKSEILIIDIDPRIVREMREEGYDTMYADMSDEEMFKYFHLENADTIVSTIPTIHENKILLRYLAELKNKPVSVITAHDGDSAIKLYDMGAEFVVYPHLLSGEIISKILKTKKMTKNFIKRRTRNIEKLPNLV